MYNRRWIKQRELFIQSNPLCIACENVGRVRPAAEVDHIIAHKGDEVLFWDVNNWQALCKRCHSRKTVREGDTGRRVVVCGQPSAGKTTYIKNNLTATDIVFDYDVLMAAVLPGLRSKRNNPEDLINLIESFRESLVVFANATATKRNVWVIVTDRARAEALAGRMCGELVDLDGPTPDKGGPPGF